MHGEVLALRKSLPPYFFGTNFLAMLLGNLANMVGHLKSGTAFTQKLVECVVSYPLKVRTHTLKQLHLHLHMYIKYYKTRFFK